ncbi:hypothetical protein O181_041151 [Austropuccinia psidii MF-1]|uniref:Uncharacterized protein n=1 Tax=Austropuccinia psidii MF-1 TaxID=1389203 RepID=A0A9Q3DCL4_9BASI|nr:hypothetical protein [Austropuccinia psidii MF-1]
MSASEIKAFQCLSCYDNLSLHTSENIQPGSPRTTKDFNLISSQPTGPQYSSKGQSFIAKKQKHKWKLKFKKLSATNTASDDLSGQRFCDGTTGVNNLSNITFNPQEKESNTHEPLEISIFKAIPTNSRTIGTRESHPLLRKPIITNTASV